jgi:hypothetical protein
METWKLRNVDQKYLKIFEIWCWRRMEKIVWTDRIRNEEILHRIQKERNILRTIKEGNITGFVTTCVGTVF